MICATFRSDKSVGKEVVLDFDNPWTLEEAIRNRYGVGPFNALLDKHPKKRTLNENFEIWRTFLFACNGDIDRVIAMNHTWGKVLFPPDKVKWLHPRESD